LPPVHAREIAKVLVGEASICLTNGDHVRSARLFGAVHALVTHITGSLGTQSDETHQGAVRQLEQILGSAFAQHYADGMRMPISELIEDAKAPLPLSVLETDPLCDKLIEGREKARPEGRAF